MLTDLCFKCSKKDSILCTICGIAKDGAREHFNQKPITNADRIRAMTDEELADIFRHLCCPYSLGGNPECTENKVGGGCKGCWLDWLKGETQDV